MKRYNLTVTRVSGYTVDAECADEAIDLVLTGEVEANGEETVGHTIEESSEPPEQKEPEPPAKQESGYEEALSKFQAGLDLTLETFEASLRSDLTSVGIRKEDADRIIEDAFNGMGSILEPVADLLGHLA